MSGQSRSEGVKDPSVAPAEAILDRVAARAAEWVPGAPCPRANLALWICACVSTLDAPLWLLYDRPDGALMWCRIPDGAEATDIVEARLTAGGHADPAGVLAWLRGDASDPWAGGHGWGEEIVVRELGQKLLRS